MRGPHLKHQATRQCRTWTRDRRSRHCPLRSLQPLVHRSQKICYRAIDRFHNPPFLPGGYKWLQGTTSSRYIASGCARRGDSIPWLVGIVFSTRRRRGTYMGGKCCCVPELANRHDPVSMRSYITRFVGIGLIATTKTSRCVVVTIKASLHDSTISSDARL